MKDAGLNAIDVYYPWNSTASAPASTTSPSCATSTTCKADPRRRPVADRTARAVHLRRVDRRLPAICRDPSLVLRCRRPRASRTPRRWAVREWFGAIVRIASRANLPLFQIENESTRCPRISRRCRARSRIS
jgi:hypothetical protein